MLARTALLFALLAIATTVLTGAWFGTPVQTPPLANAASCPQEFAPDPSVADNGLDAVSLLEKAIARIEADNTGWLRTKIRQTTHARSRFVAEGFLQRGPCHCARLEMEVINNTSRGRLTIVSDGALLAKVQALPGAQDAIHVEKLPDPNAEKESFLVNHGCGGPRTLLCQLRDQLKETVSRTGLLGNRPVIQINGKVPAESGLGMDGTQSAHACVYLNAKTLSLVRVEWLNADKPSLQIDFLDLEMGRELTAEECARVFSYHPAGNEHVTHK